MVSTVHEMLTSIGLLILRLGAGGYMAIHGWGKLQMLLQGNAESFPDLLGIGSSLSLVMAMLAEFGGAILVMIGLATRFASVPIVFTMGVAAFLAHASDPWTAGEGFARFMAKEAPMPVSKEPALLFMTCFLTLVFTGPGRFSLDSLILARWQKPTA